MAEKDVFYQNSDYLLREIFIREKGKGNALNEGICLARNDWFVEYRNRAKNLSTSTLS